MTLSVIIPVYKTEHTLDRCIESVLAQDVDSMEVIVINDGSPDSCPSICDSWSRRDRRIKVIHQNNSGLSAARNAGIDIAQGDYITFVDSDDYLSPDVFMPLLKQLELQQDTDILEYSIKDCGTGHHHLKYSDHTYSDVKDYWLSTRAWNHAYAWNKIYKRSMFRNIRFPQDKLYEDLLTLPLILKHNATTVATTSKGYYNYCHNPASISQNITRTNIIQLLKAEWQAAKTMGTHPFSKDGWHIYMAMAYRIADIIKLSL